MSLFPSALRASYGFLLACDEVIAACSGLLARYADDENSKSASIDPVDEAS